MTRAAVLSSMVGQPWEWSGRNCWDVAAQIQRRLFGRILPHVDVPDKPSWKWMRGAVAGHAEHANWREVEEGPHGLIAAADGALVLMGRFDGPGHIGVWLRPEASVIHCDRGRRTCLEGPLALRQQGWRRLRFYEPMET